VTACFEPYATIGESDLSPAPNFRARLTFTPGRIRMDIDNSRVTWDLDKTRKVTLLQSTFLSRVQGSTIMAVPRL
jgi:hypothetical protein